MKMWFPFHSWQTRLFFPCFSYMFLINNWLTYVKIIEFHISGGKTMIKIHGARLHHGLNMIKIRCIHRLPSRSRLKGTVVLRRCSCRPGCQQSLATQASSSSSSSSPVGVNVGVKVGVGVVVGAVVVVVVVVVGVSGG